MIKKLHHLFALAWLAVIVLLGLYSSQALHDGIQFDLMALLPQNKTENLRLSNTLIEDTQITGRLLIAFGHEESEKAVQALDHFRQHLSLLPVVERDNKQIEVDYKSLFSSLYPYRTGLLSKQDRRDLLEGQDENLLSRAVADALSPFGNFAASDPFGFYPRYVISLGFKESMETDPKGNIILKSNSRSWSIFQGEVKDKIFSLKLHETISETLQPILSQIEKEDGVEIVRIGTAFYAAAGAQKARADFSNIGLVSTLGITLIMLLVFRSIRPILLALTVISSGLLGGFAICLFVFGSVHFLALVFGCSLVGVAVDYALHYYCASFKPIDRYKILSLVVPAMPLGVLTSSIGYGALILAPFPGIQQMAVLACAGLVCTFISVSAWGPYFIKSGQRNTPSIANHIQHCLERLASLGSIKNLKTTMICALLSVFVIGVSMLKFDDNVKNFQSLDSSLKSQEEQIQNMMNLKTNAHFLAVTAQDMESMLQAEENLFPALDRMGANYRALADLIPSQKCQKENADLRLKFCDAKSPVIEKALGITLASNPPDDETLAANAAFIQQLPAGWKELVHIGENGLVTGRIVIHNAMEAQDLKKLPGATFVDPLNEYSQLFSSYRQMMLMLLGCLILAFALTIIIRHGVKASIAITSPVLLSMLTTIGILGFSGVGFSLFHAMGLVLVLCIGIDYSLFLYWRKHHEKELLLLGNALAASTTILSFGLLILSTTTAVYSFGLTVLMGIILNFLITTLFVGNVKCVSS